MAEDKRPVDAYGEQKTVAIVVSIIVGALIACVAGMVADPGNAWSAAALKAAGIGFVAGSILVYGFLRGWLWFEFH